MMVLDSGAISRLAEPSSQSAPLLKLLRRQDRPPIVPTLVLVECLMGANRRDANVNRALKMFSLVAELPEVVARRAAHLRYLARRGSAVDAVLVAAAEPGGAVLTTDVADIGALAAHAEYVTVVAV